MVSAFIGTAFAEDDAGAAKAQWRQVVDQFRPKVPKLALHSTTPIECPNGEIKRRTEVVGIFPNAWAATRTKAIT